jgi:urease accessory protein
VQEFYLSAGANLVLIDWMTSGRIDNGESWEFEMYRSTNHIYVNEQEADGDFSKSKPIFLDSVCLEQGVGISVVDRMRGFHVVATMVIYGPKLAALRGSVQKKVQELTQGVFTRRKSIELTSQLRDYSTCSSKRATTNIEPLIFISCSPIGLQDEGLVVRVVASNTELMYNFFKEQLAVIVHITGACPYAGR